MKNIEQENIQFKKDEELIIELFKSAFEIYNSDLCPCAYPRFRQIIGINCSDTNDSFQCFETEILISLAKPGFNVEKSELTNERLNEKWVCKKCESVYEYGWSDFSIAVSRQKLKLIKLKAAEIGKPAFKSIPLYLGLMGHSYPPENQIFKVEFEKFRKYILEQ
jgi:hypothetical protein